MKRNLDCFVALSAVLFLISSASAQDLLGQVGRMAQVAAPAAGNLAYHRPVMQSSTDYGGDPRRANDGNTDGNYWIHSTSHTRGENQPWWQVDLGSLHPMENIRIWNRTDCCGERLANFFVFVSDAPFPSGNLDATRSQPGVWNFYHTGVARRTTDIRVNRTGRYVRVQLSGANYLQLTEVEVFGGAASGRAYTDARRPAPVSLDLTGRWRCNDGGSYYLRQLGDRLWWFGQSGDGGQSWSNVFHGRMEGAQVRGNWADVPHGRIMNSGEMVLQILAPNYLRATHRTGGFGGSEWTR